MKLHRIHRSVNGLQRSCQATQDPTIHDANLCQLTNVAICVAPVLMSGYSESRRLPHFVEEQFICVTLVGVKVDKVRPQVMAEQRESQRIGSALGNSVGKQLCLI